ncbi:DUF3817 domain-containing protein [Gordonia sp. HY002]|uniref:DUF3817 domain-containing protein n=1 Tax=Gordonia zhenghanii TaxID=2911516 RepID=UPI001EF0F5F5|nr:DUF3817 domain-containing protein [Gordonia zhenghanii]MCF8569360.1 DUF3817 domain-containing protein [Gordonia zhenghanii]MCF8603635.1 DUF3817 domain-containing protein [Gordonia zhenghanii]
MKDFFTLTTPAKCFRFIAVVEAITWAALLIGMAFKYGGGFDTAVRIPGMAHGAAFVAYLVITLWAAYALKWNLKTLVLAGLAAIPPFFSVWFEVWARRNGHLGELSHGATARGDDDVDRDKLAV